jgi:hypothetical protein
VFECVLPIFYKFNSPSSPSAPYMRFEALIVMDIKVALFWVVTPNILIDRRVYRRVGGACCVHLPSTLKMEFTGLSKTNMYGSSPRKRIIFNCSNHSVLIQSNVLDLFWRAAKFESRLRFLQFWFRIFVNICKVLWVNAGVVVHGNGCWSPRKDGSSAS